jgi:hypothetical protein
MSDMVDAGNLNASVDSEEQARKLREDFADLVVRVNMDLTNQRFNPRDPVSVEMAIEQTERSIDFHLQAFASNEALQALAPDIKKKFRDCIKSQSQG